MNVSMTEVATTMRTRFESGGTVPEPADILKSNNGRYQQVRIIAHVCRGRVKFSSPSSSVWSLFVFQHALGCFYGGDNDNRHRAYQPGKEEVLKKRKNIMDHEVHDCHCSPVPERNQRIRRGLLESLLK